MDTAHDPLAKLESLFDAAFAGHEVVDHDFFFSARIALLQLRIQTDEAAKQIADLRAINEKQEAAHRKTVTEYQEALRRVSEMADEWRKQSSPLKT